MHLLWDAQRQAGTGYVHVVHMYTLFTLRLIAQLPQYHEDYLQYTDVTSALDYKWTGVMDMETVKQDANLLCCLTGGDMLNLSEIQSA